MTEKPECDHKATVTLSLGSLWGPFEAFCRTCGVCTTNPDVESKLESVQAIRKRDQEWAEANARYEALSPEEKEKKREELLASLKAGRKDLEKQLKPFQQRHNCLRRCNCWQHRRLD